MALFNATRGLEWPASWCAQELCFGKMDFGTGVITGIRIFEEFVDHLDAGAVLQYHALKVYKVDD